MCPNLNITLTSKGPWPRLYHHLSVKYLDSPDYGCGCPAENICP